MGFMGKKRESQSIPSNISLHPVCTPRSTSTAVVTLDRLRWPKTNPIPRRKQPVEYSGGVGIVPAEVESKEEWHAVVDVHPGRAGTKFRREGVVVVQL